ncbi:hypothetical protein KFL_002570160 [Klebsormidium nitens]|uniref:Uncharacterized protein n=1 Tax=Klebsormidium nitens TaxID=105231 RepID=A0A1Y1ICP5_KLENI|nr:hypothetical protein KFL_002570160 [Klebsormidium nitens]|eukprot:GAQ85848.1 hypothetical protein KFL_002570160 [Klebsormidium nitens]
MRRSSALDLLLLTATEGALLSGIDQDAQPRLPANQSSLYEGGIAGPSGQAKSLATRGAARFPYPYGKDSKVVKLIP